MILNGIEDVATKPDLLDRAIIVKLPRIEACRPEAELLSEFESARPRVLGALLDAIVAALRNLATTRIEPVPRMADAALWVTAAEPALPWPPRGFLESYTGNRNEANEIALDADPIAGPVLQLMEEMDTWEGTATELLSVLEEKARARSRQRAGRVPPAGSPASSVASPLRCAPRGSSSLASQAVGAAAAGSSA